MSAKIYLRTWGDLACFTRPEMKVERVSYPVITPSAARGLLEAIFYRPQFRWRVHRIAVKQPIRFLSFRRNEVKSRVAARNPEPLFADEDRTQRNTLALRDVEYVIEASLELTPLANHPRHKPPSGNEPDGEDNLGKYYGMFQRRAEKGQCFCQPCLGCREFPAHFELTDEKAMRVESNHNADADLGLMLYDVFDLDQMHPPGKVKKPEPRVTFFWAALRHGILVEQLTENGNPISRYSGRLPDWTEMKKQLGGAP